MSQTFLRFL